MEKQFELGVKDLIHFKFFALGRRGFSGYIFYFVMILYFVNFLIRLFTFQKLDSQQMGYFLFFLLVIVVMIGSYVYTFQVTYKREKVYGVYQIDLQTEGVVA